MPLKNAIQPGRYWGTTRLGEWPHPLDKFNRAHTRRTLESAENGETWGVVQVREEIPDYEWPFQNWDAYPHDIVKGPGPFELGIWAQPDPSVIHQMEEHLKTVQEVEELIGDKIESAAEKVGKVADFGVSRIVLVVGAVAVAAVALSFLVGRVKGKAPA